MDRITRFESAGGGAGESLIFGKAYADLAGAAWGPGSARKVVAFNRPDTVTVQIALDSATADSGKLLRQVQQNYESPRMLSQPGVELWAANVPAIGAQPSGDLVKAFTTPDGTVHLFTGDMHGHGIEAGKLAVRLHSAIDETAAKPEMWGAKAGKWLLELDPVVEGAGSMAMMSHLALNPANGRYQFAAAGQNMVYVRAGSGRFKLLKSDPGAPLGYLSMNPGQTRSGRLSAGSTLLQVSDGAATRFARDISERNGEGFERYLGTLGPGTEPMSIARRILTTVSSDWKFDDSSYLMLRWPLMEML